TALEAQQQAIVALPRRVDGFLVDEQGIDQPADLNELLPVTAVAGEAGNLAGGDGADVSEADLGDHALEAGTGDVAGSGATEIVVHDFDLAPAELPQTVLHGVLELLALQVVYDLERGRLPDVEDGPPLEMMRVNFIAHDRPPCPRRRAGGRCR